MRNVCEKIYDAKLHGITESVNQNNFFIAVGLGNRMGNGQLFNKIILILILRITHSVIKPSP